MTLLRTALAAAPLWAGLAGSAAAHPGHLAPLDGHAHLAALGLAAALSAAVLLIARRRTRTAR